MSLYIILAPTVAIARAARAAVSIEAEYGQETVQGSLYTAAHHGQNAGNQAPCVDNAIPRIEDGKVLVSHIDLDTIGGCGRVMGHPALDPRHRMFWALAAHVDVNGPHRLAEARKWDVAPAERIERELYAYWAWSQANRGPRLDPQAVHDVTDEVKRHLNVILDIFAEGEDGILLKAGDEFRDGEVRLNADSWVQTLEDLGSYLIAVRVSPQFVNHLYTDPTGKVADWVLALNTRTGAITLSWGGPPNSSANACTVMQAVFGPEAGGHKGIAGSPRGIRYGIEALWRVLEYLQS